MIFNIVVALCTGFMTIHNANTIKEDYNTPFTDCKVWGFEDGGAASKIRWASKIGLDTVSTAASGLACVDAASGGHICTKAIRDCLGGFESGSDLKEKYSKLTGDSSKEQQLLIKESSSMNQPSNVTEDANVSSNNEGIVVENESTTISSTNADDDSNTKIKQDDANSETKETEIVSDNTDASNSSSTPSDDIKNEDDSNKDASQKISA